jgi:hypothetical protein
LENIEFYFSYVTGEVGSYNNYEVAIFNTEQEMLIFEEEFSKKRLFKPLSNIVLIEIELKNILTLYPISNWLQTQLISSILFVCKTSGMAVCSTESLINNISKDNIFTIKLELIYHQNLVKLLYENLIPMGLNSDSEIQIQIE